MRLVAYLAATVAGLLLLASPVCAAVAIWTAGPDAGRWGGTALLLFLVGFIVGAAATMWIEDLR